MTSFLRLLDEGDKSSALLATCLSLRDSRADSRIHEFEPELFRAVPGAPFAYWVSKRVHAAFHNFHSLHAPSVTTVCSTNPLNADFRYVRLWWEPQGERDDRVWYPWAKGGAFSKFYYDIHTVIQWGAKSETYFGFIGTKNRPLERPASSQFFFRPGITWPRRTNGLSFRAMPRNCIFADKGPALFIAGDRSEDLLALNAIINSHAFSLLVSVQLARTELAQSFEVGLIQQTPIPKIGSTQSTALTSLARRFWRQMRRLDSIHETSHAFQLPGALRSRLGDYDPQAIELDLREIHAGIDDIAFDLYDFGGADRAAALGTKESVATGASDGGENLDDGEDDDAVEAIDQTDGLLSWATGVAFGRFDWRLATGERSAPPEPDPFDPLPAKSPGMLPDGAEPFHIHYGILADDLGHADHLARLIEAVLERVDAEVPSDVRRWLQRDFFDIHLKQYSKSRRKAPIYWPLSTTSGSYTLWVYYPDLTSQTLYTAVNDFIEPKLKQVGRDAAVLRDKGSARSRDDEKAFEGLQSLELELIELRDTLLRIAPTYKPNHDDGVQITAAPLWPLFTHKPWQKVLKDTWVKLEKGDYDWAHLAMAYWPNRVREKCRTDKSLAIAHGLEDLYEEAPVAKKKAGKKGADS